MSLHLYRNTRSAKVVEEVFGFEELFGYLVVDRYASYNHARCKLQYCYAHLLREIKDLRVKFENEEEVEAFQIRLLNFLRTRCACGRSKPTDALYYKEAEAIKSEILRVCHLQSHHLAIKRWQDFFVENANKLYHWVSDRRVPCENNRAEREPKPNGYS